MARGTIRAFRLLALSALCLGLTACGFTPVYGPKGAGDTPVDAALNAVAIASIPEREGQMLRNHLIDRMYGRGRPAQPKARLVISIRYSETDLGIQKDATASRQQLDFYATYTLQDLNGATLVTGTAHSLVSTSKLDSQYATLASERNARERALMEVAEQIVNRLSLYYAKGAAVPPPPPAPATPATP